MTALPPVVSLLAALGPDVPPPLPPAADFLAILTAAEGSVAGPSPEVPDASRGEEPPAAAEKPKKEGSAEAMPVPWMSVPIPVAAEPAPPPITLDLAFRRPPDVPVERAEGPPKKDGDSMGAVVPPPTRPETPDDVSAVPIETPEATRPRAESVEAPEATGPQAEGVETPKAAIDEESPGMRASEKATPKSKAPVRTRAMSAPRTAEEKRAPRERTAEAAPPPATPSDAPEATPTPPAAQIPVAAVPPLPVEIAPAPAAKDIEAPRQPEIGAQAPLAFGARLVAAKPEHTGAKVSSTTASAPAPETQRRTEPHPAGESKTRAVRPPVEDSETVTEGPREQPATYTPPSRDASAQNAPERADAVPKADGPEPTVHAAAAPPDAPKTSPIARDIRLEIGGADRRVELRVIERAGDVQVAVRTPDERLAGALRENLPLLSSRLEQSGFRADQWRAADAGGAERRLEAPSPAESSGRTPEHRGGNEQQRQQQEERRPTPPDERRRSQEKGTAFEWLMQSLR